MLSLISEASITLDTSTDSLIEIYIWYWSAHTINRLKFVSYNIQNYHKNTIVDDSLK